MLIKSKAIVLRSVKYGDQKVIVDLYTEGMGRVACAIKLSSSSKGKMKKQLFQPLTILDIETDYRPKLQFQRLVDVRLAFPWTSLAFDVVKMNIGMFLAEVLCYSTRAEQQDERMYDFIDTSLRWLDLTDDNVANFHIVFLIMLSRVLGWDIGRAEEAWQLNDVLSMTYDNMQTFPMTRQQRAAYLNIILAFYRRNVPSFPEMKSLAVMKQVFGEE